MTPQPQQMTRDDAERLISHNASKPPEKIAADLTLYSQICLSRGKPSTMFWRAGQMEHWMIAVHYLATENEALRARMDGERYTMPVIQTARR